MSTDNEMASNTDYKADILKKIRVEFLPLQSKILPLPQLKLIAIPGLIRGKAFIILASFLSGKPIKKVFCESMQETRTAYLNPTKELLLHSPGKKTIKIISIFKNSKENICDSITIQNEVVIWFDIIQSSGLILLVGYFKGVKILNRVTKQIEETIQSDRQYEHIVYNEQRNYVFATECSVQGSINGILVIDWKKKAPVFRLSSKLDKNLIFMGCWKDFIFTLGKNQEKNIAVLWKNDLKIHVDSKIELPEEKLVRVFLTKDEGGFIVLTSPKEESEEESNLKLIKILEKETGNQRKATKPWNIRAGNYDEVSMYSYDSELFYLSDTCNNKCLILRIKPILGHFND